MTSRRKLLRRALRDIEALQLANRTLAADALRHEASALEALDALDAARDELRRLRGLLNGASAIDRALGEAGAA